MKLTKRAWRALVPKGFGSATVRGRRCKRVHVYRDSRNGTLWRSPNWVSLSDPYNEHPKKKKNKRERRWLGYSRQKRVARVWVNISLFATCIAENGMYSLTYADPQYRCNADIYICIFSNLEFTVEMPRLCSCST